MALKQNGTIFAQDRKQQIAALVSELKTVTVMELCDKFGVSGATVRADLRDLQMAGVITRTHGGAIEKKQAGFELTSKERKVNLPEKQNIARAALDLIQDGDKIILDTGTTTYELAVLLEAKKSLTVLTNDIEIARLLESFRSVEIMLMGGIVRNDFHCTVPMQRDSGFPDLKFDKAFMGANSLALADGATTPDIHQAEGKKQMIAMANKVIFLCDSSKIGNVSFVQFASVEQIDSLVVGRLEDQVREKFEENGVEVILCDQPVIKVTSMP